MTQRVIWQNEIINIKDWKDLLKECYPEITDPDEQYQLCCEENDNQLHDERENLNITLCEEIIAIADIGRWDGVKHGYRECKTHNIRDLLWLDRDCDTGCFYVDGYRDMRSRQHHHDGTNFILYRMWKPGLSAEQKENFLSKLYDGTATKRDVSRYTQRIGDPICNVYGW